MRVVLINPPFTYNTPWMQVTEPLGILYLASYLREHTNHEIAVLDCLANRLIKRTARDSFWYGLSVDDILSEIDRFSPDVVGISCMFSRKKEDFLSCAHEIKTRFPNVIIVAGGTYPSLFSEEVISTGVVDYCVIGEGESSLMRLLDALQTGIKAPRDIDGLAYSDEGELFIHEKTRFITDLDEIPFPARDLINYEAYITRRSALYGLGLRRSASILTSRSCPNRCNFCSMFRIHGPRWRGRTAENVLNEIRHLVDRHGISDFFIMDDNFTINRERVKAICNGIISTGLKIRWNTPNGISINTLDSELLHLMKRSGCRSICIAIESGDEELRNRVIGKHLSDSKIEDVVRQAAEQKISVTAFYIIGMPGETQDKFRKTLEQIKTLPLNGVAAAFANPLPGTKLYEDCLKNDHTILEYDSEKDNVLYKPFIVTKDFTCDNLLSREKEFYRVFVRSHWLTLVKDALLGRNLLLYPPYLMRVMKDRLFRD